MALLFIDIDHFKQINDSLGHAIGDDVLIKVAERFSNVLRKEDTLSRLGGDEFTIIIENIDSREDIHILANKLLNSLHEAIGIDGHIFHITCSIGVALYPQDSIDASSLIPYVDTAMYKAKDKGRNNVQFYS